MFFFVLFRRILGCWTSKIWNSIKNLNVFLVIFRGILGSSSTDCCWTPGQWIRALAVSNLLEKVSDHFLRSLSSSSSHVSSLSGSCEPLLWFNIIIIIFKRIGQPQFFADKAQRSWWQLKCERQAGDLDQTNCWQLFNRIVIIRWSSYQVIMAVRWWSVIICYGSLYWSVISLFWQSMLIRIMAVCDDHKVTCHRNLKKVELRHINLSSFKALEFIQSLSIISYETCSILFLEVKICKIYHINCNSTGRLSSGDPCSGKPTRLCSIIIFMAS